MAGTAAAYFILNRQAVGFGSLEDLVITMAEAIEAEDEDRLTRLCHDPIGVPFERLARQHATLNYVALLRKNQMWKSAYSWTLGGCGFRNGHIHIVFVKQLDGKWYMKRIGQCR